MKLSEKQRAFAKMVPRLIDKAYELGYEVTLGDAYRDSRCPYGSKASKHKTRQAIDLNLFLNGKYLRKTEDHRKLGEWWKSVGGIWGGDFKNRDGNHYQGSPDGLYKKTGPIHWGDNVNPVEENTVTISITSSIPIKIEVND